MDHKSCIGHKCFIFSKKNIIEKRNFAVSMLILRCQCLDFRMAFKLCCINNQNDVAQTLGEMTESNRNEIELEKKTST